MWLNEDGPLADSWGVVSDPLKSGLARVLLPWRRWSQQKNELGSQRGREFFFLFRIVLTHCFLDFLKSIFLLECSCFRASLVVQMVKNLPVMRETWAQSLGQEDPPGKGMATHSRIPAWRIPWTEESGGLQSLRLQVRHGRAMEHTGAT